MLRVLFLAILVLIGPANAAEDPCAGRRESGAIRAFDPTLGLVLADGTRLVLADVTLAAWPRGLAEASSLALDGMSSLVGQSVSYKASGTPDALGRRKAHLWVGEDWLQAGLVAQGRVRVAPERAASCAGRLLGLEAAARQAERGIWSEERVADAHDPDLLRNATGTYQLVAGRVRDVAQTRAGTYVNFGDRWRFDTTVLVTPGLAREIGEDVLNALEGRPVLVRGWIENVNGPLIRLRSPLQLRPIDE